MLFEKHTGFLRGRKRKPQLQKQLHVHPYYLLIYLFIKDRKSTRLNSSHGYISYAVFCLKKKKPRYSELAEHASRHAHSQQEPPPPPFRVLARHLHVVRSRAAAALTCDRLHTHLRTLGAC